MKDGDLSLSFPKIFILGKRFVLHDDDNLTLFFRRLIVRKKFVLHNMIKWPDFCISTGFLDLILKENI